MLGTKNPKRSQLVAHQTSDTLKRKVLGLLQIQTYTSFTWIMRECECSSWELEGVLNQLKKEELIEEIGISKTVIHFLG